MSDELETKPLRKPMEIERRPAQPDEQKGLRVPPRPPRVTPQTAPPLKKS